MPLAFISGDIPIRRRDARDLPRVLVTGAGGRIGGAFARRLRGRYRLRLLCHHPPTDEGDEHLSVCGEVVVGDLLDEGLLSTICDGIDTVVHLAADPSPSASWEEVMRDNIDATYRLLEAAASAGCRRVVLASSIHAVSGHPPEQQVEPHDPVAPGDLYGVSKCTLEALGRYFATQRGLSTIAVRIGGFQPPEAVARDDAWKMAEVWVSRRDLVQLLGLCVDDETLRFAILHGVSRNRFNRLDLTATCALVGYRPEDDFCAVHPALKDLRLAERIPAHDERSHTAKAGLEEGDV